MTNFVKDFRLHVILTRVRDSAMSRSYAHFWSFYSWDHSSRHELVLWAGFQLRKVNFCDRDCTGNIAIVRKLRAVLCCIPMFWGDDAFGHAQRVFSYFRRHAWPQVLLGLYARDVCTEYHQENFEPDVLLDSIVSPGWTYCPCKVSFILPSKTFFLS